MPCLDGYESMYVPTALVHHSQAYLPHNVKHLQIDPGNRPPFRRPRSAFQIASACMRWLIFSTQHPQRGTPGLGYFSWRG